MVIETKDPPTKMYTATCEVCGEEFTGFYGVSSIIIWLTAKEHEVDCKIKKGIILDGKETWKGYPMGKDQCPHCGADTYITGRGTPKGWSGIECCACGNLIENCHCVPKCRWCGSHKEVPTGLCPKCAMF